MSRNTRSGFSRSMSPIAELPSPHSATISKSASSSNRLRRRPRASASSSLSNTRIDMFGHNLLSGGSIRDANFHRASAAAHIFQHHRVVVVIKLAQAAARVSQPDSFRRDQSALGDEAHAVVADFQ